MFKSLFILLNRKKWKNLLEAEYIENALFAYKKEKNYLIKF